MEPQRWGCFFHQQSDALQASGCGAEPPATVNQYDARALTWRRGVIGARREVQAPPARRWPNYLGQITFGFVVCRDPNEISLSDVACLFSYCSRAKASISPASPYWRIDLMNGWRFIHL